MIESTVRERAGAHLPRLSAGWPAALRVLESDRAGVSLCASALLLLLLSVGAAAVADPESTGLALVAAALAAAGFVLGMAVTLPRALVPAAAAVSVLATGLYAAATFEVTPTVVWLFAYVVPAVGLARGRLAGAVAGLVAAPVLHGVETGVLFDPLDPQGPFGFLILIALGAAPAHLMHMARTRRLALNAQLARAEGLLAETERARAAEDLAKRQSVFMLARAAEARDGTTGAHIYKVRDLAAELARATGADAQDAERVGWSAMLHDVGKLRVPDRILLKPGRLDPDEWELIKNHAVWGEELLEGSEQFDLARVIARWHHERWDGTGYPDRLSAAAIPFPARIVRVVDLYDALRSERPYKRAWSEDEALTELRRLRGVHVDPELTDVFLRLRGW